MARLTSENPGGSTSLDECGFTSFLRYEGPFGFLSGREMLRLLFRLGAALTGRSTLDNLGEERLFNIFIRVNHR